MQMYADAVANKGGALNNCFGFIDGTVCLICRPGLLHQRVIYNSHKRVHALKFQSLVTPNGLVANLYGPVGKFSFNIGSTWQSLESHSICSYSFNMGISCTANMQL